MNWRQILATESYQRPGDIYSQSVGYRNEGFGTGGPDYGSSVQDVINYEVQELDNEHMQEDAAVVEQKFHLNFDNIDSRYCVWVCRKPEDALFYTDYYHHSGKTSEEKQEYLNEIDEIGIPPNSIVISDLGQDGVLLLLGDYKVTPSKDRKSLAF